MPRASGGHLQAQAKRLFGVEVKSSECERLDRFLDLLDIWSKRTNLISARSRGEIVDRHILDSIAPLRFVRQAAVVADFGSGAGLPAIPLAILAPATRFHLVESRRKRATFLRHVARALGLTNVRVREERGEEWTPGEAIDVAIGRAIRADLLAALSLRVLTSNGRLIVMRKHSAGELRLSGFVELERAPYNLPSGEQHEIVVLRRAD